MIDYLHKWLLRKHLVDEVGGVRFYARGRIHRDIASQISTNTRFDPPRRQINVFVGAHRWVSRKLPKHDYNIGIQTEQFFDQGGARLWGLSDESLPDQLTQKFSHILDLDQNNRRAYSSPAALDNVTFGPFIFPSRRVAYAPGDGSELIFVGAMNERRAKKLEDLRATRSVRLISKLYSRELEDQVRLSAGLVNIHFHDGIYTEWPRALLAYLCGKVLYSEELASPMHSGRHYIPLASTPADVSDETSKAMIFSQFASEIAETFAFGKFLDGLSPRLNAARQAGSAR